MERKWESCRDCIFLAETCSHPCTDGKPISNRTGYACVLFYMLDGGPVVPNWKPDGVGCEMHTTKEEGE